VGIRRVETAQTKALANEDEVALSSIELDSCPLFQGHSLHKCAMVEENLNKARYCGPSCRRRKKYVES